MFLKRLVRPRVIERLTVACEAVAMVPGVDRPKETKLVCILLSTA